MKDDKRGFQRVSRMRLVVPLPIFGSTKPHPLEKGLKVKKRRKGKSAFAENLEEGRSHKMMTIYTNLLDSDESRDAKCG